MPSSLAISNLTSLSSNTPSSPPVPPTSFSSGVHTVPLLSLVATQPTRSNLAPTFTMSTSSERPFISRITMTTTVAATVVPSVVIPSVLSSTTPTSAKVLTTSSTPSVIIVTTRNVTRPTTSTSTGSMTSSIPGIIQLSVLTSTSPATTVFGTIVSPTPVSAPSSNTLYATTSPTLTSGPLPQSFPGRTNVPLTTVLENTTIFIINTNSQGQVTTSIPPVVTEVIITTGNSGIATTITQTIVNPTLAPNRTTGDSSFFNNTGAVVGVFLVVGLASASIMMWILFAIRHRQRMKRIEQDTAAEAAVAAAGLSRAPLDDDDEVDNSRREFVSEVGQRSTFLGSGSLPTSMRLSTALDGTVKDSLSSHPEYLVGYRADSHSDGYILARTTSPSPRVGQCTDDLGSSRDRRSSYGHTPTYSAGSFEPLLTNCLQNTSDQETSALTTQSLQRGSLQHQGSGLVLNGNSHGTPEDGSGTSSKSRNSSDSSAFRDEEGCTRYVLMVRNVPDDQSQHSL